MALRSNPKLRPIRIKAGALGAGLPSSDMMVSRQRRLLVSSHATQQMLQKDSVLIPVIKRVGLPGIEIAHDAETVIYNHVLFEIHEIVFADDVPAESLYLEPHALTRYPKQREKK